MSGTTFDAFSPASLIEIIDASIIRFCSSIFLECLESSSPETVMADNVRSISSKILLNFSILLRERSDMRFKSLTC